MNPSALNIYERIVREKLNDPYAIAKSAPRILVKRHAISKENMRDWLDLVLKHVKQPDRGYAQFFSSDFPSPDITEHFRPAAGGTGATEDDLVELDFARYSHLPCNPKSSMVFSFSVPVPIGDSQIFYGEVDRGFLFAHGYLCRYAGAFSDPSDFSLENIWRS